MENITESAQSQQGAKQGIDLDQQRLVLSLLDQITPAASIDGIAAARANTPQSMKPCVGNPFWVPLSISVVFLISMACLVKRSCKLKQQRPSHSH